MRRGLVALLFLCVCAPAVGRAQEFKVGDRHVQVHGFFSQGFVYSNDNNWLTMKTSQGSGAMTDMGLNLSLQLTDKFRVGAQVYDRNLGQLGQWHPTLDWAVADFQFAHWFGVRAGKVKTTLGLYNDSQDLDFLHVFALLPQSVYSADLRDTTIAHAGGDVYGTIILPHQLGDLSYTAYAGHRSDSIYSGYPFLVVQWAAYLKYMGGLQYGGDLRWNTPLKGFLLGASRMNEDISADGVYIDAVNPAGLVPYYEHSRADWTNQFYGQYQVSRFCFDAEYRRYLRNQVIMDDTSSEVTDVRGWYVAGTYRLNKRFSFGSYYSRYTVTDALGGAVATIAPSQMDTGAPASHTYDKVVTASINFNRFWNLKIEGHFMEGYGNSGYPAGFYPSLNPNGFAPSTNALVLRTAFHF